MYVFLVLLYSCNTLRLCNVLPNFAFTTSQMLHVFTYKHGIYELPHELPNNLRFRILENQEISTKCLKPHRMIA